MSKLQQIQWLLSLGAEIVFSMSKVWLCFWSIPISLQLFCKGLQFPAFRAHLSVRALCFLYKHTHFVIFQQRRCQQNTRCTSAPVINCCPLYFCANVSWICLFCLSRVYLGVTVSGAESPCIIIKPWWEFSSIQHAVGKKTQTQTHQMRIRLWALISKWNLPSQIEAEGAQWVFCLSH